jgi:hypothetical protein
MSQIKATSKPTPPVKVKFSSVGEGYLTGMSMANYCRVNDITVGWLVTANNQVIDHTGWFSRGEWKLFIDDERNPIEKNWVVARSSQEAIDYIKLFGTFPQEIAFDHDLGDDDTSIKLINWMTEMLMDEKYSFHKKFTYFVHSQNPIGKNNIDGLMTNLIKHFKQA